MENDYELTEWQVEEVKRGLEEAERGEFLSADEFQRRVTEMKQRYKKRVAE